MGMMASGLDISSTSRNTTTTQTQETLLRDHLELSENLLLKEKSHQQQGLWVFFCYFLTVAFSHCEWGLVHHGWCNQSLQTWWLKNKQTRKTTASQSGRRQMGYFLFTGVTGYVMGSRKDHNSLWTAQAIDFGTYLFFFNHLSGPLIPWPKSSCSSGWDLSTIYFSPLYIIH